MVGDMMKTSHNHVARIVIQACQRMHTLVVNSQRPYVMYCIMIAKRTPTSTTWGFKGVVGHLAYWMDGPFQPSAHIPCVNIDTCVLYCPNLKQSALRVKGGIFSTRILSINKDDVGMLFNVLGNYFIAFMGMVLPGIAVGGNRADQLGQGGHLGRALQRPHQPAHQATPRTSAPKLMGGV